MVTPDFAGDEKNAARRSRFSHDHLSAAFLPKIGHNPPREAPKAVADAILELLQGKPR
jgi:pimeloyl-ACP methyl ester carboxylesterase